MNAMKNLSVHVIGHHVGCDTWMAISAYSIEENKNNRMTNIRYQYYGQRKKEEKMSQDPALVSGPPMSPAFEKAPTHDPTKYGILTEKGPRKPQKQYISFSCRLLFDFSFPAVIPDE